MKADAKRKRYRAIRKDIMAVLEGEHNQIARMATVACMLNDAFETFFWTGFYLVDDRREDELVVGPYQGSLGCLRIPFGKGVCGAAAATGRTHLVRDVAAFPGHIACDPRAKSEIVVPVFDGKGNFLGVLDIDSAEYGTFDDTDRVALEDLMRAVFAAPENDPVRSADASRSLESSA